MANTVTNLINLARPRNSISVVIAVCVGFAWYGTSNLQTMSIAAFIMFLINSAATVANDVSDIKIDAANGRKSPLLNGQVSVASARLFEFLLLVTALLMAALYLPFKGALICLGLAVGFSWAYNNAPFYASRKPIASVVVLASCVGALTILFGAYSADQPITRSIYLLALGWFLQRASLVLYKDFKDYKGDKLSGKQTFLVRYGQKSTKLTSLALSILGLAIVAAALLVDDHKAAFAWTILLASLVILLGVRNLSKQTIASNKAVFVQTLTTINILDFGILVWLLI